MSKKTLGRWTTNGDDIAQDNEIGPSTNDRFGIAALQRAADDLQRTNTWDYSVAIQQELIPGVSLTGAWYHTQNYDLQQVTNVLLSLSDYAPFQIANPLSGESVTVFNLDPALGGALDNVTGTSDINRRTYNGFELSLNARLPNGGTLLTGWFTERTVEVSCDTNDPNQLRFCDQSGETFQELGVVPSLPFRHEFKIAVSYPLPYDFETSAALLSYPGAQLAVSYPVPVSDFPNGRTRSVTLDLIPPGTKHAKRWNQFDVSLKRRFRAGNFDFLPTMDIYNLFNSSVVLSEFQSFGPSLGRPFSTLQGRMLRLSVMTRF